MYLLEGVGATKQEKEVKLSLSAVISVKKVKVGLFFPALNLKNQSHHNK